MSQRWWSVGAVAVDVLELNNTRDLTVRSKRFPKYGPGDAKYRGTDINSQMSDKTGTRRREHVNGTSAEGVKRLTRLVIPFSTRYDS